MNPVLAEKTTLIPLDLTHQAFADASIQSLVLHGTTNPKEDSQPSTLRRMFHDLLMFFAHTYATVFDLTAGPPLHDPLAVAILLPDVIRFDDQGGERFAVEVVTQGAHGANEEETGQVGRTVVTALESGAKGVTIPRSLDTETFWRVIEECLHRAETQSQI